MKLDSCPVFEPIIDSETQWPQNEIMILDIEYSRNEIKSILLNALQGWERIGICVHEDNQYHYLKYGCALYGHDFFKSSFASGA